MARTYPHLPLIDACCDVEDPALLGAFMDALAAIIAGLGEFTATAKLVIDFT